MSSFYLATSQGYVLRLLVVPGASRTEVAGLHGDRLRVRVAAAPEKGAANKKLLDFLAKVLGVPKKTVSLTTGAQSREKVVAIETSLDLKISLENLLPDRTGQA